jgi:hypothetical protein
VEPLSIKGATFRALHDVPTGNGRALAFQVGARD